MGYNTAAIILNDQIRELRAATDAGDQIYTAIVSDRDEGRTRCGVSVLPSDHSSAMQIVAVGGNTIRRIGHGDCKDDDAELLRKLADQLGYRLVKKGARDTGDRP